MFLRLLRRLLTKHYTSRHPLSGRKALWVGYQRPCLAEHTHARAWGSLSFTCTWIKPDFSDMMAARFLRRAFPVLRQTRSYAEAATGAPQMSFTFASPTQVSFASLRLLALYLRPSYRLRYTRHLNAQSHWFSCDFVFSSLLLMHDLSCLNAICCYL